MRVVRAAALVQVHQLATSPFMLFTAVLQPIFIAVTSMYMLRHRADVDPSFVIIGAGLSGLWSVALFDGAWSLQSERWCGTLEALIGAPTAPFVVLAGKMVGSFAFTLVAMATSYLIGTSLFGYHLENTDPVAFAVALVATVVSLWAVAMLFAPLGILWRPVARLLNVLEYPVYTLAGFMFPIALLPSWSHGLSYALPPYWAARALHGTASGALSAPDLATAVTAMGIGSGVALTLASLLMRLALRRARATATLALT